MPSTPAFWDAGWHPASQRRTSSEVIQWVAGSSVTTLLVRRRPTSEPGQPYRIVLPVDCPVAQLCGMCLRTGRSYLHNRVPGTPVGRLFRGSGCGHCNGYGHSFGHGYRLGHALGPGHGHGLGFGNGNGHGTKNAGPEGPALWLIESSIYPKWMA